MLRERPLPGPYPIQQRIVRLPTKVWWLAWCSLPGTKSRVTYERDLPIGGTLDRVVGWRLLTPFVALLLAIGAIRFWSYRWRERAANRTAALIRHLDRNVGSSLAKP